MPRVQLPLQTILHFQPLPPHLAIPYLEAIASREGCLDMSALPILYAESTFHGLDIGDHPLPPNGHEPVPHFGLRRAITQMQFDRGPLSAPDDLKVDSREKNLGGLQRQLDVISFVDASIAPRTWAVMDVSEICIDSKFR